MNFQKDSDAEQRLQYILRIMSISSNIYLMPYVVEKSSRTLFTIEVMDYGLTYPGLLPPFSKNMYEDIFSLSCVNDGEIVSAIRKLDPAIRWFLAPAQYLEGNVINSLTAIESIISVVLTESERKILQDKLFSGLKAKIAEVISVTISQPFKGAVEKKLAELNRHTFLQNLLNCLNKLEVSITDIDDERLNKLIKIRNSIVHRGFVTRYHRSSSNDAWEDMTLASEICMRICLKQAGFSGKYISYFPNYHVRVLK